VQNSETKGRLEKVMGTVLKCGPDAITPDAQLHKFPRWDSLAHIQLVLAVEKEFGIRIRDAEMVRLISFAKLMAHLEKVTSAAASTTG
jgi:acyl carrier protein